MEKKAKQEQFSKEKEIIGNLNRKLRELIDFINASDYNETLSYNFIVELAQCKKSYEKIFPQTKKGGFIFKLQKLSSRNELSENSISPHGGFIVDKHLIIPPSGNMFDKKTILPRSGFVNQNDPISSFAKLLVENTRFRKSALMNRLQVANSILESKIAGKEVELYKINKIKFSVVLKKVRGLNARRNAPVLKLLSKSKAGDKNSINKCVKCKLCLVGPCPHCGNQVIYCVLKKLFNLSKPDRDACMQYEW